MPPSQPEQQHEQQPEQQPECFRNQEQQPQHRAHLRAHGAQPFEEQPLGVAPVLAHHLWTSR